MRFAEPYALLLLLLLPLLLFLLRGSRPAAVAFSLGDPIADLATTWRVRLRHALPALRYAALALCIVALARPQYGIEATKIYREGIAIAMVVDISSSMAALDLTLDEQQSNRLDVVKRTFQAFVEGDQEVAGEEVTLSGREGDLIGMFTFARYTDAMSPLTLDHEALLQLLQQVEIVPLAEEDGTAIGDAIGVGIEALRRAEGASRVMILLTDGSNNAGDTKPLAASQVAAALGIKIYTIGTGTRGTAMMPARTRGGGVEMRPTPVFIDEHTLEQVAQTTGGKYFRATDVDALRGIYGEIDRLEKARNVSESYQQYIEAFPPLLIIALGLLALEVLLANTRLRSIP